MVILGAVVVGTGTRPVVLMERACVLHHVAPLPERVAADRAHVGPEPEVNGTNVQHHRVADAKAPLARRALVASHTQMHKPKMLRQITALGEALAAYGAQEVPAPLVHRPLVALQQAQMPELALAHWTLMIASPLVDRANVDLQRVMATKRFVAELAIMLSARRLTVRPTIVRQSQLPRVRIGGIGRDGRRLRRTADQPAWFHRPMKYARGCVR